jgi:hypothetical protein
MLQIFYLLYYIFEDKTVSKKEKNKDLSPGFIFDFLIGDKKYDGSKSEYKDALKIYSCCTIKKKHNHCIECSKFHCSKYDNIKKSMKENGYNLIKYQKSLKKKKSK